MKERDIGRESGQITATTLPNLPAAVLYELCAYLWPRDISYLVSTARNLAFKDENGRSNLVGNGLSFFRPTKPLPAAVVEDLIARHLPPCRALQILDLSSAELTPSILLTLGRLAAVNSVFQCVSSLSLWDNNLGSEGCLALAEALGQGGFRSHLRGIYIRANQITCDSDDDVGMAIDEAIGRLAVGGARDSVGVLCQVLKTGVPSALLTSLSLAQNNLGHLSAMYIGDALAAPALKRLRKLDLHLNRLGDRGVASLAEGISAGGGMPCLDELYLGYNKIGDAGARAVAGCLEDMVVLRELDLASNAIGNEGALAFAMHLSDGGRDEERISHVRPRLLLETLDLKENRIGDDGACAFRDFLACAGEHESGMGGGRTEEEKIGLYCPKLLNIFLDQNRAIRARGRNALQVLQTTRGIRCMEGADW